MWDIFGTLGPALTGLLFLVLSLRLGLGSLTAPGPGLWPFIISLLIIILAGGLFIGQLRRPDGRHIDLIALRKPLIGLASTVVYALALGWLGYMTTTLLLLLFWIRFIGKRSWRTAVLVAIPAVALSYGLFGYWLGVPLPSGLLF